MSESLPDTPTRPRALMDKITHRTWFRTLIEGLVEPHVFFMRARTFRSFQTGKGACFPSPSPTARCSPSQLIHHFWHETVLIKVKYLLKLLMVSEKLKEILLGALSGAFSYCLSRGTCVVLMESWVWNFGFGFLFSGEGFRLWKIKMNKAEFFKIF